MSDDAFDGFYDADADREVDAREVAEARQLRAHDARRSMAKPQKFMVLQIPSEANAERLMNERLSDMNALGWTVTQITDHNGFLVCLLDQEVLDFGAVS